LEALRLSQKGYEETRAGLRGLKEVVMSEKVQGRKLRYEEALQAVGRFAEKERLRDICLMEVEGGMVVQGLALISTRQGFNLALKTQILSYEDLGKLLGRK
jgi:hypothetical protein